MKQFILLAASLYFFVVTDAQKRYYTPAAYQISAHDKQGQLSLSIARGNGYDANLSYSILDNICILLAYGENKRYEKRTTVFSAYGIQNNNTYKTLRVGYFKDPKVNWLNRFETYVGYSHSTIDNYWSFLEFEPGDAEYAKASYNSIFIGTDLSWDDQYVEFSTSLRFNCYRYDSLLFYQPEPYSYYPTSYVDGLRGINFELILSVGFRYKGFKLFLQGGLSIPVSAPYAIQTDISPSSTGTYTVSHRERLQSGSVISRLGLQFTSGSKKKAK